MIRGMDDKGAVFIGLVPGTLMDRLRAGERVGIPGFVGSNGVSHTGLWLDFSGGPRALARLLGGERVCIPRVVETDGRETHPHVCLFYRESNEALIAALREYFPDGFLPGAELEHVSQDEPR